MSMGTAGILPSSFPPVGPAGKCQAALVWLCLTLGWLVPTYYALGRAVDSGRQRGGQAAAGAGAAAWVLEHCFCAGLPGSHQAAAWAILLVFAWMAAGLLAMRV